MLEVNGMYVIFLREMSESIIVCDNMVKHNESEWNSSLLGRKK